MADQLLLVLLTAVVTAGATAVATVQALKVHVFHHYEAIKRHDVRITALERGQVCDVR